MSPASLRRAFFLTMLLSSALWAQAQLALKPEVSDPETSLPAAVTTAPVIPMVIPPVLLPDAPPPTLVPPASVPIAPVQPAPVGPVPPVVPVIPVPVTPVPVTPVPVIPVPGAPVPAAPVPVIPVPVIPVPSITPVAPAPALPGHSALPTAPVPSAVPENPVLPTLPPVAVRGLWVDGFGVGLKTRAQAKQTVNDAARLGINTLFVQAIRRGDCLCMKSGLPLATDSDLEKNYDPLAVVTRLAHDKGIRVIAWASVTGIINVASPSKDPKHVMWSHGANSHDSWLARRTDGSWQVGSDGWLDAGIPAAADYAAQSVVNLVRYYDIDGVQLDRIRYPDGGNWGYDLKTITRFNAEMGKRGRPLPSDPVWQQWKRDQVTALVRRIALEVKSLRPGAWMTAATITYGTPPRVGDPDGFRNSQPYNDVLQDWVTWIHEGLIDLNVPMNYKRDGVGDQGAWFTGWNAYAGSVRTRADGLVAPLAIGTALYLNTPQVSASQAARSVQAGLGWVGYSYRVPTLASSRETLVQGLETLRQALTAPGAVLATPQRWQDTPPTSHGLIGRVSGVTWPGHRTVEAWQAGRLVATSLTDGNGYYGFLTLPAGKTEVRVGGQSWTDTVPDKQVVHFPDLLLSDSPAPVKKTPAQAASLPVSLLAPKGRVALPLLTVPGSRSSVPKLALPVLKTSALKTPALRTPVKLRSTRSILPTVTPKR
ncbi:family 10 glycosylhydrolase [Deinococcus sp.]|uniref:glycoside hydrolase family 10 protein n=1 Tax=Deinococcus sp. TaxID=47478 RepID=UPI0025BD3E61|nr:family 10 glycosylhydrolase [Deinococcus sp.]